MKRFALPLMSLAAAAMLGACSSNQVAQSDDMYNDGSSPQVARVTRTQTTTTTTTEYASPQAPGAQGQQQAAPVQPQGQQQEPDYYKPNYSNSNQSTSSQGQNQGQNQYITNNYYGSNYSPIGFSRPWYRPGLSIGISYSNWFGFSPMISYGYNPYIYDPFYYSRASFYSPYYDPFWGSPYGYGVYNPYVYNPYPYYGFGYGVGYNPYGYYNPYYGAPYYGYPSYGNNNGYPDNGQYNRPGRPAPAIINGNPGRASGSTHLVNGSGRPTQQTLNPNGSLTTNPRWGRSPSQGPGGMAPNPGGSPGTAPGGTNPGGMRPQPGADPAGNTAARQAGRTDFESQPADHGRATPNPRWNQAAAQPAPSQATRVQPATADDGASGATNYTGAPSRQVQQPAAQPNYYTQPRGAQYYQRAEVQRTDNGWNNSGGNQNYQRSSGSNNSNSNWGGSSGGGGGGRSSGSFGSGGGGHSRPR